MKMAGFADLSPCTYFGRTNAAFLRSVGWLERGRPFATGSVNAEVLARLIDFVRDPVQPSMMCGVHRCDLCAQPAGSPSNKNVFIPSAGVLFVCPEGIVHYIKVHAYQPPAEFCEAVLACPPMRSDRYMEAVLANGLARWVHRYR
jgi:hypothetical protein